MNYLIAVGYYLLGGITSIIACSLYMRYQIVTGSEYYRMNKMAIDKLRDGYVKEKLKLAEFKQRINDFEKAHKQISKLRWRCKVWLK